MNRQTTPDAVKPTRGPRKPPRPTSRMAPIKVHCEEEGVPYTTMRDAVLKGEIPVVKIGRAWYLERADVSRWRESHKEVMKQSA